MSDDELDQEDLPPEERSDDEEMQAATSRDARGFEQLPSRGDEEQDDDSERPPE